MPSTYTTNLGIELPADGELDGVWGDVVNENMDILDRAINGSIALSLSGTTSTLTTSDGALSDGQYKLLVLGGSPSGTHTITIAPSDAQKIYFVRNTTAQSVVFTQGSGGNVTVATGDSAIIYSDGAGAGAAVVNITNDFAMSSVKITGGTIDGTVIGGTSAAAVTGTTITGTSFVSSGDMTFGDSDKAIFGAGSDLQIYHDGTNSYIKENNGTGHLVVNATNLYLRNSANSSDYLSAVDGGAVTLKYNGISTIATTATGVDVTGTVTADGLTSQGTLGNWSIDSQGVIQTFTRPSTSYIRASDAAGNIGIQTGGSINRALFASNGDISFYEDTGTTPKFFWDASAERLGIGTSSPVYPLDMKTAGLTQARFESTGTSGSYVQWRDADTTAGQAAWIGSDGDLFKFYSNNNTLNMTMTTAGNVGIGTTAPAVRMELNGATSNAEYLRVGGPNSPSTRALRFSSFNSGADDSGHIVNASSSAGVLAFQTNSAERMRIDSSGNVGIGTATPNSGANAGFVSIQTPQNFGLSVFRNSTDPAQVAFVDTTNSAAIGTNGAGSLVFFNAPRTTERMRIDSNGRVGIGTTGMSYTLDVRDAAGAGINVQTTSGNAQVRINSVAGGSPRLDLVSSAGTQSIYGGVGGVNNMVFYVNATERVRIDASGNVGIGTTTPAGLLEVFDVLTVPARNTLTIANKRGLSIYNNQSAGAVDTTLAYGNTVNSYLAFGHHNGTSYAERMRIDASGNLLVGKTAADTATVGAAVFNYGMGAFTRSGSHALDLNRTTSDGAIINLRKDNTTVGSIGAFNGDTVMGTGLSAVRFNDGVPAITPHRMDTNATHDASTDLGQTTVRFKDLYLSGGVYLGGTGAANLLDDYEEGTFTAELQFGGATTGISYINRTARYVKIGTLVYINIAVTINSKGTATGAATIAGLPFTQSSVGTNYPNLSLRSVSGITFTNCLYATADDGAATITLMDDNGSGTQALLTNADFLNATEFNITGVYEAA